MNHTEHLPRAATLHQLAALGPHFAIHTHLAGTAPAVAHGDSQPASAVPWRTLTGLRHDPGLLRGRLDATRTLLAAAGGRSPEDLEPLVVASSAHLGLVARLTAPLLALAALHGQVPSADPDNTWWQPQLGAFFPLSVPVEDDARAVTASADAARADPLADRLAAVVLDGFARFLTDVLVPHGLIAAIARGNTASAIHAASAALTAARPHAAHYIRALTRRVLAHPRLRDAHNDSPGPDFQRRTCCLIHRAAPAHGRPSAALLCADCPLTGSQDHTFTPCRPDEYDQ